MDGTAACDIFVAFSRKLWYSLPDGKIARIIFLAFYPNGRKIQSDFSFRGQNGSMLAK
jgi:hypothetical protein